MHGSGRGGRKRVDDAQPLRSLGGISVARLSPTSHCKDSNRRETYEQVSFTFCGYTFRPRMAYNRNRHEAFTGFMPAISPGKLTAMSRRVASWRIHRRVNLTLDDLAPGINQILRGCVARRRY